MIPPRSPIDSVDIPPCFHVVAPSHALRADGVSIVLGAGTAFGDGKHETTQLCLQALATFAPRSQRDWRMLDFGSGSGILAIGAAKLGARVLGVEIDEQALATSEENARLSSVAERVTFTRTLAGAGSSFDVIVANILRRVLVDAALDLAGRLVPSGTLILSGLVSTDVPEVSAAYAPRLGGRRPEIYQRGEWRALAWRAPAISS